MSSAWSRLVLLSVALFLLAGCSTPHQVRDVPATQASWMHGRRVVAQDSQLKLIFDDDSQKLQIKRIEYKVRDGDLYVWPVRGAEPFEPAEFALDVSPLKLRQPWREHVYWVEAANWDGPLNALVHVDPLGNRVDRVRADVVAED